MAIKFTAKKISQSIMENFEIQRSPEKILTLIENFLKSQGIDEATAFETASEMLYPVRDEISQILQRQRTDGVISSCELVDDDFTTIIGSAYKRPRDTSDKLKYRESLPYLNEIWQTLVELQPYEFELFCTKLLKFMGAEEAFTSKRTRDEGIDFIARLRFRNTFGDIGIESIERNFFINIFGQAKRYNKENKVGTGEIRELIGSLSVLRYQDILNTNVSEINNKYGTIKLCDPIISIFLTTGLFSPPAKQLAETTGVVIKDGKQLSTYLAIHRIGFEKRDNILTFTPERLLSWISGTLESAE
jgi:hypothetical protein